jgi:hypothetical protein
MAATPYHDQDPFDPNIQELRDSTDEAIYHETGGMATDANIMCLFHVEFDGVANRVLAHDVMKTDHWKMKGITMVALADRMGTNHGTVSRWYTKGILPQLLWRFLMANPNKPPDWQAPIDKASNARLRGAFMNIAKYLFGKLPGHSAGDGDSLREIHAEALFDILDDRARWEEAKEKNDFSMAGEIVHSLCDPSDRQILPPWYTKKQARKVLSLIKRLQGNNRLAFKYLCRLQRHWEGVFVLTAAAMEQTGWV